jgi:MFS transporter, ACDE family, multidrug resistance protein
MTRNANTIFNQPRAVWAVAFAAVVAFMGIGLVDPILPSIATALDASPSDVSLMFTSYFAMTGVSMLLSSVVASRIGARRTLLGGLLIVVLFSALAGASNTVAQIVGFRFGWGLGNALFIATALSVMVGAATGGLAGAIVLFEAALGVGIASGPLLGGLLGGVSWRAPFFGTGTLMAIGFIAILVLLRGGPGEEAPRRRASLAEPLRALSDPGLRSMAIVATLYNYGFFTILAYTPFPLHLGVHQLGLIYFGWGLLLAVMAVFAAQRLERRFGLVPVLGTTLMFLAADLLIGGAVVGSQTALIIVVIVSGAFLGVINTVVTEGVMTAAKVDRPIASSSYNFVRFTAAAAAPWIAGKLGEHVSVGAPLYVGGGVVVVSVVALVAQRRHLHAPAATVEERAALPATGSVVVALPPAPASAALLDMTARAARARDTGVLVAHIRETRPALEDAADVETGEQAHLVLAGALAEFERRGIPVAGEVVHITGHHDEAARAIANLASEVDAPTIIVGGPAGHGGDPSAPSVAALLTQHAPCNVFVVREAAPAPLRAAA